jgi:membrane fusion protein, multidrug efflux system
MRWYGQVGIAAVLGLGAYGVSQNWPLVQTYLPGPVLAVLKPLFPDANAPVQAAAGPARPGGGQAPVVEVVKVATGMITEVAEAVGTTRAFESVVINAKISGMVEAVLFSRTQGRARGCKVHDRAGRGQAQ